MSTPGPLASPLPWNLVSAAYAAEVAPGFEAYAGDALRLAQVVPGGRVLDTACGPGTLSLVARRAGHPVAAIDFAEEMILLARARLAAEPGPEVDLRQADGQSLPFEDGSFDAAFSMFGLIFYPDRDRGLRELRRVVRPGAPVTISSWHPIENIPQFTSIFAELRQLLPDLPPGGPPTLATEAEIGAELGAAGFTEITIHTVSYAMTAPDADAWLASLERTLAPLVLLRHHQGDAWNAVRPALAQRVAARLGPGPVTAAMPAWITVARAP